jgi:hypothetical protein
MTTPACNDCITMVAAPVVAATEVAVTEVPAPEMSETTFTIAPVAQEATGVVVQEAAPCGSCAGNVVGASMGYDNCNSCCPTTRGFRVRNTNDCNTCCNTTYAMGCNNDGQGYASAPRTRLLGSRRSARCCY